MGGWNSTRSVEGWTGGRGDGSKKTQIFFFFEFVCVYSSSLTCEDFKWVPKYIYILYKCIYRALGAQDFLDRRLILGFLLVVSHT